MQGYGQFCPVAMALEVLGERWTLLVVREVLSGSRRFGEIQRGVPLMSPTLLSQRLARLQRAGIVERRTSGGRPEYLPTAAGRELWPVVESLGVWGQRWARAEVLPDQLDPGLLMWDVRRRVDPSGADSRRVVVAFHFTGVARGAASWWLVLDRGAADLCLSDPGFGVDATVEADLRAMIEVWMGDRSLAGALRGGEVRLQGRRDVVRALPGWLRLNVLAGVPRPERPGDMADPAVLRRRPPPHSSP
jgi:DNA-binding HxlR family transcriptional regulator